MRPGIGSNYDYNQAEVQCLFAFPAVKIPTSLSPVRTHLFPSLPPPKSKNVQVHKSKEGWELQLATAGSWKEGRLVFSNWYKRESERVQRGKTKCKGKRKK